MGAPAQEGAFTDCEEFGANIRYMAALLFMVTCSSAMLGALAARSPDYIATPLARSLSRRVVANTLIWSLVFFGCVGLSFLASHRLSVALLNDRSLGFVAWFSGFCVARVLEQIDDWRKRRTRSLSD
jgi:hypothetical protein